MKKANLLAFGVVLLSFILAFYLYPQMPPVLASHWNFAGEVDGYISKFWGLFLMPIISLVMLILFDLIPKIDPLKANVEKFREHYEGFKVILISFLFYIYILTLIWNLGSRFNMGQVLSPALGVLFYYCGILIENAKRNWFIGIRTPWTMSNDTVWEKTHKVGGKLFKLSGLLSILGFFFPNWALFLVFIPIIFVSVFVIAYSYFEYKKLGGLSK